MKLATVMALREMALDGWRLGVDWPQLYRDWPGRMNRTDCRGVCRGAHRCCPPGQTLLLLPGEGAFLRTRGVAAQGDTYVCPGRDRCLGALRPVCCRTYPLAPDAEGNLYADTACSQHKWASWHFLCQTAQAWQQLLDYGVIRGWVQTMRRDHYSQRTEVAVDAMERGFDAGYAATFGHYHSGKRPGELLQAGIIRSTDRVLVTGCGRGQGVAALREEGVDAWGVEVNASLVAASAARGYVSHGDVRELAFEDGSFDMVLSIDVLEHLPDYDRALAEMARVSRWRAYVEVTALETAEDLFEDPTHVVYMWLSDWRQAIERHMAVESLAEVSGVKQGMVCRVRTDE